MKPGFKIIHASFVSNFDIIIVDNYPSLKEVTMYQWNSKQHPGIMIGEHTVAIFKIKPKNK